MIWNIFIIYTERLLTSEIIEESLCLKLRMQCNKIKSQSWIQSSIPNLHEESLNRMKSIQ